MVRATISKDFSLSASHRLDGMPNGHQCARMHGHNYIVRITVIGTVIDPGFVIDYGEFAPLGSWLDEQFDHRHLNDVIDVNPTAEHLADHVARHAWTLLGAERANIEEIAVSVSETPKTWATVAVSASDASRGRNDSA